MKKLIVAIVALTLVTGISYAKDEIIELPVSKIINKIDKNDNPYAIVIVKQPKTLNGISYKSSLMIMCFSDVLDQIENLKEGENMRAVVSMSKYNGKDSASLIQILE